MKNRRVSDTSGAVVSTWLGSQAFCCAAPLCYSTFHRPQGFSLMKEGIKNLKMRLLTMQILWNLRNNFNLSGWSSLQIFGLLNNCKCKKTIFTQTCLSQILNLFYTCNLFYGSRAVFIRYSNNIIFTVSS